MSKYEVTINKNIRFNDKDYEGGAVLEVTEEELADFHKHGVVAGSKVLAGTGASKPKGKGKAPKEDVLEEGGE